MYTPEKPEILKTFYNSKGKLITPPYKPGEILWVRETWQKNSKGNYFYKASEENPDNFYWKPSIHMPREAARLFLKVVNVRVERLQDITPDDVRKEGVIRDFDSYCLGFKGIWDKMNTKKGYTWESNPWVWVIEFERLERYEGA